jgi:ankyrin repeat protein
MALPQLSLELLFMVAHCLIDLDDGQKLPSDPADAKLYLANLKSLRQVNRALYSYVDPIFWQKAFLLHKRISKRVLPPLIETNDLARLKFILDAGANIECALDFCPDDQWAVPSPLYMACFLENVPMARLLLEKGAKIVYGPLHAARSPEMVHLLMDFHADPEVDDCEYPLDYYTGEKPLHRYLYRENPTAIMRAILQRGANVNPVCHTWSRTPLHGAVESRSADVVTLLLEFGADVTMQDMDLNTPLHLAAKRGWTEMVRLLVASWPEGVRKGNKNLDTPLHLVAGMGLKPRGLVRWGERPRGGPEKADLVKFLVGYWPEGIKEKNKSLDTPLHLAAEAGDTETVRFLVESWPGGIKGRNEDSDTPLHLAAGSGETEAVKFLMERWPEGIREKNKILDTPLHRAATEGEAGVVRLLVESWPEGVREKNKNLDTPLHRVIGHKLRGNAGGADTVKHLVESWPEGIREKNKSLDTPFHLAAAVGDIETVKLLVERWPEGVRERNKKLHTPLHLAAAGYKRDVVELLATYWPEGMETIKQENKPKSRRRGR